MPEIVNCPQCERKLRVPDELMGQAVKCPTCNRTFTASPAAPAPPSPVQPPEPDLLQQRYEESAPRQLAPPLSPSEYPTQPYGGFGDYESEFQRRKMALRGTALAAVSGPATALLAVAVLDIALNALSGVVILATLAGGAPNNDVPRLVGNCFGLIIRCVLQGLVIFGSLKMKSLESYGLAMTAGILSVIPCCSPCLIIGIPFAIWALVVLNNPEVKGAFQG